MVFSSGRADEPPGRTILVVIPAAKQRAIGEVAVAGIRRALAPAATIVHTPETTDAMAAVIQAHGDVDAIAVGGGDGTLALVANWLTPASPPLLILPLGTANDLARTLGIPADPVAAAGLVNSGSVAWIDMGQVNGRVFFNAACVGLSADLAARLAGRRKRLGMLSYVLGLLGIWRRVRPFTVLVQCDGRWMSRRALQVCVGNGRYHGGGIAVGAEAAIDDGCLDVYILEAQSLARIAVMLADLRRGRQRAWTRVTTLRGREITVATHRPRSVSADGDLVGTTPARVAIRCHALAVYAPASGEPAPGIKERVAVDTAQGAHAGRGGG